MTSVVYDYNRGLIGETAPNAGAVVPSCVIVVENLPVPFDRRVWQEARALRQAGWYVSVICPTSAQYAERYEVLDEIEIYRHPLPLEARGQVAFLWEYTSALFHEARLLLKVARRRGFDVIQVCNPPDLLFLNALPYKMLGKRLVFDHHDLCPELFQAKFARNGVLHRVLCWVERLSMKYADLVISANDTYREIAIGRGGKSPDQVVTVYSIPDQNTFHRTAANASLRVGARIVLGYVGIIGDQDGLDHLIRMQHHLIRDFDRHDLRLVVVGDGPALNAARLLAHNLGIESSITFTGYLRGEELRSALSTFDIGIIPDPVNAYNDKISMNKVFEYSALGLPSVAYNLSETRRLLGDAGHYAEENTPLGLARTCLALIEDEQLRVACGRKAKAIANERFDWEREKNKYIAAYQRLGCAMTVTSAFEKAADV